MFFIFLDCVTTTKGYEYSGSVSMASDGSTCVRWDQMQYSDNMFWGETVQDASNYCYNPNGLKSYPICYTQNGTIMANCSLPTCSSRKQ